jgi:hypothetical protein
VHRMGNALARPVRRGAGLGASGYGDDLPERHLNQAWEDPASIHLRIGFGVGVVTSPLLLSRTRLRDCQSPPFSHTLGLSRLLLPARSTPQVPRSLELASTIDAGGEGPRSLTCVVLWSNAPGNG